MFDIHATGDLHADVAFDQFRPKWSVLAASGNFKVRTGDESAYQRWHASSSLLGSSDGQPIDAVSFPQFGGGEYGDGIGGAGDDGIGATSVPDTYGQYSLEQRGTWFKLGTITVTGTQGEVFLGLQQTNFVGGEEGDGILFYGWGAGGIVNFNANLGQWSDVPFVSVAAPEPISLLLVLTGLVLIGRRR
jgi:hypothetical protein